VKKQFQDWLKAHYGTLDNLNTRWTTAYWSQTYFRLEPDSDRNLLRKSRAAARLEHFVSDTWRSYQKNQLDAIRANSDARQFITTNMMGWFDEYDHYVVSQDLDLASWDDYVEPAISIPSANGATTT